MTGWASPLAAAGTSFGDLWQYLADPAHWQGSSGFLARLAQHFAYSAETLVVAAVIALPLGLLAGHTGRGGALVSVLADASRALPTLGMLTAFAIAVGVGLAAAVIPLILLALPSILVNTYVGVRGVDAQLVDAARGMGLRPWQVLWRVEVPVALPLVVLGLRTAALQVVSTATVAAYVGLGGLGRYIIDGEATRNYAELGAGAVVVAAFAIVVEVAFLAAQRLVVSPGLRLPA